MFGYHAARREERRAKKAKESLEAEKAHLLENTPEKEKEAMDWQNQQVADKTQQSKADRATSRQEGKEYADEVLSRNYEGLTPEQRLQMQTESHKHVKRAAQSANRNMLGEQSQHGIVGKGGVAYAQQRDLQKRASEAEGQAMSDINKLDADLALKKLAAAFGIEQGEVSQNQLDKQMAIDEIQLNQERKKQKYYEDKFNQSFSRV